MPTPWSAEQVLALAPDASSQKAARGLATTKPWQATGRSADGQTLWGLCAGSGKQPYQAGVDLSAPAYRCSCPSRKFPCKHALGLMLLWAAGSVPESEPPDWVVEWTAGRAERQAKAATRVAAPPSEKTQKQRASRVDGGLDELDRWLADQVRQGLAGAGALGYAHWERMAARLVDAQAGTVAGVVHRLPAVAGDPQRLLAELALLRLLVCGYRRLPELPDALAATVRTRIGFPVSTDEVLATPPVRDEWLVTGSRTEQDERLTTRRVWLRGRSTGRPALVLHFAAPGQTLPADTPLGTGLDADLHYYPGSQPLRALIGARHAAPASAWAGCGDTVAEVLDGYAEALAGDPWLERWPVLLSAVTPVALGSGWGLLDAKGDALPLAASAVPPWRLVAVAGGEPVTVAAEWSVAGLSPLTVWDGERVVRL
jgi:SWIM zinc finger